ncbi:MAG: murein transglycosylase domain-containing protein [Campylobacterota bacterium]|nr:murein transglycosylase domain-containing protein [Campylobacterota bacterium]
MFLKSFFSLSLLFTSYLNASGFEEFKHSQQTGFNAEKEQFQTYKKENKAAFEAYLKAMEKVTNRYQKELRTHWEEPKLSSQKTWVSYTPDQKTRSSVDFEKNEIIIETVANNPDIAHYNLHNALRKTVNINTKHAFENDPLQRRLVKIKKPKNVMSQPLESEPILSNVIFKQAPTRQELDTYVKHTLKATNITAKPSRQVKHAQVYSARIPLPKNTIHKRSMLYQKTVAEFSHRFELPAPLIFAVIHTESSYNPFAKSHIPAYGLMQIVPHSAGADTYIFLHKKKRLPSPQYLYDSRKNIEMGSAYLHILYYRYLKDISDENSRLYCAIAGYNTGAGNVAYAFSGTYNVKNAIAKINSMSPNDVYQYLQKHLRYNEPKVYMQRVVSRMVVYHKAYGEKGNRRQF